MIDLGKLEIKLEKFVPHDEKQVEDGIVIVTPLKQKMDFLSKEYPSLFIFILESFDMTEKIEMYMNKCKAYEKDPKQYSLYIQGYFNVWLD